MTFIDKIKLLFKSAKPVGEFVNQVKGARMKWKTIPFYVSIAGSLIGVIAALQGFIPATASVVITAVLTATYNILRGADKTDQVGVKPVLQTTEFWMGVGAILTNCIVTIQTAGVNPQWFTTALTIIGAAMAAGQNLAGNQPEAPKP